MKSSSFANVGSVEVGVIGQNIKLELGRPCVSHSEVHASLWGSVWRCSSRSGVEPEGLCCKLGDAANAAAAGPQAALRALQGLRWEPFKALTFGAAVPAHCPQPPTGTLPAVLLSPEGQT